MIGSKFKYLYGLIYKYLNVCILLLVLFECVVNYKFYFIILKCILNINEEYFIVIYVCDIKVNFFLFIRNVLYINKINKKEYLGG